MTKEKKLIPNYLPVWEQQYQKIKDIIKSEISKPKKERKKQHLKRMLEECKELKRLIISIKGDKITESKICPHCGGEL